MITANAIQRTFHLRLSGQSATGFVIDVDKRQYLITAKHFAGSIQSNQSIDIYYKNQWNSVPVSVVGHTAGDVDISILSVPFLLAHPDLKLPADMGGIIYGQDVYFLGFPFGLYGDAGAAMVEFPLPFVKGGILSCFAKSPDGHETLIIDAINNLGFSGGPVIFKEPGSPDFKIASVISGYRFNEAPVYQGTQQLPISVRENTGLVLSYPIRYAIEVINSNPIGMQLPS